MQSNMRQRAPLPAQNSSSEPPNVADEDDATLLQKAKVRALLLFHELPDWAKDNENIHTGFRPLTNSYRDCISSMSYLHNEAGNIYTHFFAAIWMIILGSWWSRYASERYPQMEMEMGGEDAVVFCLFFLGGVVCFALSTIYHVLMNHSHEIHLFCLKLDFLGILIVTAGCFPPGIWYTFPCASPRTKFIWIGVDLTAQFLAALLALFSASFRAPKMQALRAVVFSVMASSAFFPIIIKIFQVGWTRASEEYGASLYAWTIVLYLSSVTVYALRVTESWKPGHFDIWGHSHQIFHVGMAIGLTVHFSAFVRAVNQFYAVKGGQCPD